MKNEKIISNNESVSQKPEGTLENQRQQQEQFQKDLSTLLKSVTQKKSNEERNLSLFIAESIVNSITEFKYCPEGGIIFPSYFRRYAQLMHRRM